MKTVIISYYYGCQGRFFRNIFESYHSLLPVEEKESLEFIFSPSIKESLQAIGREARTASFLYHPYFLVKELALFHFGLRKENFKNLRPRVKAHVKRLQKLKGSAFLCEEIEFSKKRFSKIREDFHLPENTCFDLDEFFLEPEKKCKKIAEWLGLDSKRLVEAFLLQPPYVKPKVPFYKVLKRDLKKAYDFFEKTVGEGFLKEYLQAKARSTQLEKISFTSRPMDLVSYDHLTFCSEDLPDKFMFGLKEVNESRVLTLRGWFLSPYLASYLRLRWSNGESSYIFDFGLRKEVLDLHPEYHQSGKGFLFKKSIPEGVDSFDVSILLKGEVRALQSFVFLEGKLKEAYVSEKKLLSIPSFSSNFLGENNLFILKKGFDLSLLGNAVKSGPVIFLELGSVENFDVFTLFKNYERVHIDREVVLALGFEQAKFLEELDSVTIVENFLIKEENSSFSFPIKTSRPQALRSIANSFCFLCPESLPSRIQLGLKEIKDKKLQLRGWFLSPVRECFLEIKFSTGECFFLMDFDDRPEVRLKYPEYQQMGRGFSFEFEFPRKAYYFSISLMSHEKVVFTQYYSVEKYKIHEVAEDFYSNSQLEVLEPENLNLRYLLVCRPFSSLDKKFLHERNLFYCFSDEKGVSDLRLDSLEECYARIFIEKSLFLGMRKALREFVSENETFRVVDDLTVFQQGANEGPKIAFLLSSDTHVNLMKKMIKSIPRRICIVPDPKNKEEKAIESLEKISESYISFGYKQKVCEPLRQFSPDYVISLTDWTSEYLALQKFFKETKTKFITLQEGPHDWDMQFMRGEELYVSNQYRNSDIFISQGPDPLRHIQPRFFSVLGTPKIEYEEQPLAEDFLIVINCNFTYEKTKPEYESKREFWLNSVLSVCEKMGLKYQILQHPRDFATLDNPHVVKTNAAIVKDYLLKSSVVISRFSSINLEALALNRNSIYYNPHKEPMLAFNDKKEDALLLCYNESELEESLKQAYLQFSLKKENIFSFEEHIKTLNFYVNNPGKTSSLRIRSFLAYLSTYSLKEDLFQKFVEEAKIPIAQASLNKNSGRKYFLIFAADSKKEHYEENFQLYMLAYHLVLSGHKVYYYTDKIPSFFHQARTLTPLDNLHLVLSKSHTNNFPVGPLDIAILSSYFSKEKLNFPREVGEVKTFRFNPERREGSSKKPSFSEEGWCYESSVRPLDKNITYSSTAH